MNALDPNATIAIIVVVVVVVLIAVICLVCCLCRKCNQCARWTRQKAYVKEEAKHEAQKTEMHVKHDQAQQERETVRNQIRAKYNLNGYNDNPPATIS